MRICRSIVNLQELTPKSRRYVECSELIKITQKLLQPYQSVLSVTSPDGLTTARKMVQEASLADQIETQGYYLREALTTLDFSAKSNNNKDHGFNGPKSRLIGGSGQSTASACSSLAASKVDQKSLNSANSQFIIFLEAQQLVGLSQP